MPKLTDTQSILLSNASTRDSGSIFPPPASLVGGVSLTKALAGLHRHRFAIERETTAADEVFRTEGDTRFGLYATPAGLLAIGVTAEDASESETPEAVAPPAPRTTKAAGVLSLLQRPEGATLHELIEATGWLPHTTRAALTGFRKKGHTIERVKRDGDTCYRAASIGA